MQYIYVLKCDKFYKIGFTFSVPARLAQFYTGNPLPIGVVSIFGFQNAESVEQVLHQKFSDKRGRGEWFTLNERDVAVLDEICETLGGERTDFETAFDNGSGEEYLGSGWRAARKTMTEEEVYKIAKSEVSEIAKEYSLSERTALNWRNYAKREFE